MKAIVIAIGTKRGIDGTKKIPGDGFKRPWPPLIGMDKQVQKKSMRCLEENRDNKITRRAETFANAGQNRTRR